ncbi:MAG: hypothetical protein JRI68_28060 [Deltaproteobacteria bacterium]|nr:hypothetical protein [Deltaproteobacteria bacterium]
MATWLLLLVVLGGLCLLVSAVFLTLLGRDVWRARPEQQPSSPGAPPFPVDLVIPWVDRGDPAWAARYEATYRELEDSDPTILWRHDPPELAATDDRNTDVYYAVRLALQNLPWLRRVVLFTQRPQRPSWVDELPKVTVVHHDEVFPSPTYNGMVTTAAVVDIPGLADHYIQMDDDLFIVQPLPAGYFFDVDGRPVLRLRSTWAWPEPRKPLLHYRCIITNTLEMLLESVGLRVRSHHNDHQPTPCTRTLVQAAKQSISQDRWQQLTAIRSRVDFDFFSYYLPEYLFRKHRNALRVGPHRGGFVEGSRFTEFAVPDTPVLCVNNVFSDAVREYLDQRVN